MIKQKTDDEPIVLYCTEKLRINKEEAYQIIIQIRELAGGYSKQNIEPNNSSGNKIPYRFTPDSKISQKYYRINNEVFRVEYESKEAESLCHPKFANLEIQPEYNFRHYIRIYHQSGMMSLWAAGKHIGSWPEEEGHFLGGKFSMQILQKIYGRDEDEWLGVFHAAGVTDGNNCIMFLGDSGSGKSTLSALLLNNELDILADDFLPVENEGGKVCRFPAAISVKEQAYNMLAPQFPELLQSTEYCNPHLNKTFRYLPLSTTDRLCVPCKGLVFVKYEKNTGFRFEEMSREEAFQKLIPDSWLSPKPENVRRFMEWFNRLSCYRIVYSDNKRMVQTVKNLLKYELL